MKITILSWNIASSGRDAENGNPTANRLRAICARIYAAQTGKEAQIVLIQEIRPTEMSGELESKYSAADVVEAIRQALGRHWNSHMQRVNQTRGAFYRATLWDSDLLVAVGHRAEYTPNTKIPQFAYLILTSDFAPVRSSWCAAPLLSVLNLQAPVGPLPDKEAYWEAVASRVGNKAIAMGDQNKYEEQMDAYQTQLALHKVYDMVEAETFLSFPYDHKSDGSLYRSCLDVILMNNQSKLGGVETFVESTEDTRESDHYIVGATFDYEF